MKQRILPILLTLALCLGMLPTAALAAGETGAFTVTGGASGTDYSYSDGVLTVNNGANITISAPDSAESTIKDKIVISENATATITLNNVNAVGTEYNPLNGTPAQSPIDLSNGATLALILADNSTNSLAGGTGGNGDGAPGIHVPKSAALIIQGSGSLSVTGGASETGYGGVGIGGRVRTASSADDNPGEDCGTVIVFATGTNVKGGASGPDGETGDDIGGGKGSINQDGDDGQGIKPTDKDNTYEVWGELTLPDGVKIPEGATLTGEGSLAEGSKIKQDAPTSAPTVSQITDTSVTLNAVTGGKTQVHYARVKGTSGTTPPTIDSQWDPKLTITSLDPATAYTFYARYCETNFYQASPASPGLTVITAPHTSAVSINYEAETISILNPNVEVSPNQDFSTLFQTNESILAYFGLDVYVRAKVKEGTAAPMRGVTTVRIPPRPNHADSITVVNASAEGVSDGKITGVSANMEYKKVDADSWMDCAGDTVEHLAPGAYYVRTKATENSFASIAKEVTIDVGNIITIELPTFDSVYAGYTTPDPKPIKIHNSSGEEVTITGVSCTGEVFNIRTEANPNILKVPAGGTNSYYALQPRPGLSPREYASTITVTYRDTNDNSHAVTATARFTVLPQPTSEDDRGDGGDDSEPTYGISAPRRTEGGSVHVRPTRAEEGDTVTITVKPDEGYELEELTVTDRKDRALKLTGKGEGRYTFQMPASRVEIQASFRPIPEQSWVNPFRDVPEGAWYYEGVAYVHANGLMAGTGGTAFSPEGVATRGQIVTILWRLAGSPGMEDEIWGYPYADVDANAYYATAVYWARMNGIASGYTSQQFGPNDTITREQLAAMLYRFAGAQGWDTSARADLSRYADAGQVSAWAVDALRWANAEGLIAGTSAATLTPGATATRAQVAVILMRFCENIANT